MMNLSTLPSFYFFPKAISSAGESCMYSKTRQDLRSHTPEKEKKKKCIYFTAFHTAQWEGGCNAISDPA